MEVGPGGEPAPQASANQAVKDGAARADFDIDDEQPVLFAGRTAAARMTSLPGMRARRPGVSRPISRQVPGSAATCGLMMTVSSTERWSGSSWARTLRPFRLRFQTQLRLDSCGNWLSGSLPHRCRRAGRSRRGACRQPRCRRWILMPWAQPSPLQIHPAQQHLIQSPAASFTLWAAWRLSASALLRFQRFHPQGDLRRSLRHLRPRPPWPRRPRRDAPTEAPPPQTWRSAGCATSAATLLWCCGAVTHSPPAAKLRL